MDSDSKAWLYESLLVDLRSAESRRKYEQMTEEVPPLNQYSTVEQLLGILRAGSGVEYGQKDGALKALLDIAHCNDAHCSLAIKVLLMAMWPALDHTYYKLRLRLTGLSDLFAEIYWAFLAEVEHFPRGKRTKIAANLRMNTEKRVRKAAGLEGRYQRLVEAHWLLDSSLAEEADEANQDKESFLLEGLRDAPEVELKVLLLQAEKERGAKAESLDDESGDLAGVLEKLQRNGLISPEEELLLKEHAINGLDLARIAERLGLKEGTIRVRYFRAKAKLRTLLEHRSM